MATIAEAFDVALKYHTAGQLAQAEKIYDQIIQADPYHADALNLRGVIAYQVGDHAFAAEIIRRAVTIDGNNIGYLNNLGVALSAGCHLDEAVACYCKALQLAPNYADAYNNLGNALKDQGKLDEAVASYRQALSCKPDHADAHNNLGNALKDQGNLEEALASYRQAVRLRPEFAQAHSNLGAALRDQGKLEEAVAEYRLALHYQPNFAEMHVNLGCALRELGRLSEAIAAHQQAIRLKPDYADAHNNLGNVFYDQGKLDEATACFTEALRLRPHFAEAHYNLGTAQRDLGEFEQAEVNFKGALRLRPNIGHAYYNLGQLSARGRYEFSDDEVAAMKVLLADPRLPVVDRSLLYYTLGDLSDKLGRFDDAFEHFRQANDLRRQYIEQRGQGFTAKRHVEKVERIIATCTPDYFERVRSFGIDTELPVFVVGMPRSGTTLVEQILCSHPQVFGAGELKEIPQIVDDLPALLNTQEKYPLCLSCIDRQTAQLIARRYLNRIKQLGGSATRVVDKLPRNRRHLGLIYAMFPKAHIIMCRRDPLDTCLSLYFQHFENLSFTTSLDDIALMYRLYEKTRTHWLDVLPANRIEVRYEDLVENQEAVSRQLIAFLGLEWDDRCLAFHEKRRAVQTASSVQVRQPIYRSSIGRWKNYESQLQPLIAALGSSGQDYQHLRAAPGELDAMLSEGTEDQA